MSCPPGQDALSPGYKAPPAPCRVYSRVVHERLIPQALRRIQRFIAQLVGDLSSLMVLADGVGAGGEQAVDRVLSILLLLPHHGTVLPASHARILRRNAIAILGRVAVGGEKVCSAAAAPAGRMAVL